MDFLAENINSILIVVYCFIIGIMIAFIYSLTTKAIYGKLVDALVKAEADSPEKAKSLSELGIKDSFILRLALSRRTTLSSLVSSTGDGEINGRGFYVLPEHQIKAQGLYGIDKLSPLSVIIAIVLFAIILFVFHYVVPRFI